MEAGADYAKKLNNYYDDNGRLKQYPSKKLLRNLALARIADAFEPGREYNEKEVNAIILNNISFGDFELIRREMITSGILLRLIDGSKYWRKVR